MKCLCCVCVHGHLHTLMMQESCTVGMRNAIVKNHLEGVLAGHPVLPCPPVIGKFFDTMIGASSV